MFMSHSCASGSSVYGTSVLPPTVCPMKCKRARDRCRGPRGSKYQAKKFRLLFLTHGLHRRFGIDESVAVQRAIALADQIEKLAAEGAAAFVRAEELRATGSDLA